MIGRRIFSAAIAASLAAAPVSAQSLGDIARQEEARRASVQKPARTLSNGDLDPSEIAAPGTAPAGPSCYMSKSKGQCVSAEEMLSTSIAGFVTKENAPFEQTWRQDAASLRSRIESTQRNILTLEALAKDEARSPADRKGAERTLVSARQALAIDERAWEKLEKSAANQHVPRAWIEPIPTLTKNQPQH